MTTQTTDNGTATQSDRRDKTRPPYVPYLTVKNFIGRLKQTTVPHRVDKSVMGHLSGAAQSHLLLALKFLNLIDDAGRPQPDLDRLVTAYDTPEWSSVLATIVRDAYSKYLNGLNLLSMTPAQLSETFKEVGGTEGTVTDKAIRFFLKALSDSGIQYSKHVNRIRGPRQRRKKQTPDLKNQTNGVGSGDDDDDSDDDQGDDKTSAAGMITFPIHLPGKTTGKLSVPRDITDDDVDLVALALDYVRLYAKHNAGGKSPTRKEK
jgi:hypothetical protein